MNLDEITGTVVHASIKVHTAIGPGCFEPVYEEALYYELIKRDLIVSRQILMPIRYEVLEVPDAYKIDLLVERKLILEIKAIEKLAPVHFRQVMTYLKLAKLKNGILLDFTGEWTRDGIHR